ncbi:hypothetical protein [Agrococcus sp. ProA11]|uniref:hypothetical protein n=1 Tax=Agrococcus chionoecetis TaxID=3153752 RepID=UPI003260E72A
MHAIANAAHATSVPLNDPFMILIVVSAIGVTASFLALLGGFALVVTGRAE